MQKFDHHDVHGCTRYGFQSEAAHASEYDVEATGKKPRGDPENLVPARKIQCAGDRTESALASSKGEDTSVSASTRSLGDLIAKPWGVETPEIVPELPGKDAAPSHVEVLKLVKGVAANVVTTLPTFFKNHKKEFGGLGFEVQGDMHPSHYDALALPTSVVVLV